MRAIRFALVVAALGLAAAVQTAKAQVIDILDQTPAANVGVTLVPGTSATAGSFGNISWAEPPLYEPAIVPGTPVLVEVEGTFNAAGSILLQFYQTGAMELGGTGETFNITYTAVFGVPDATNGFDLTGSYWTVTRATITAIAAPGPVAGAGIPALLGLAGLWFYARRRRQRQNAA